LRWVKASTRRCGTCVEPVVMQRKLSSGVCAHSGCSIMAWMVAGTSTVSVGRSRAIASSAASGAKRACSVTVAPSCSAGVVWMLRPPTWNMGSTVST
jgi:hypothetical protein